MVVREQLKMFIPVRTDAIVKTTGIIFRVFLEQQRTKGEGWIQTEDQQTLLQMKKKKKRSSRNKRPNLLLNTATISGSMVNTSRVENSRFCSVVWELSMGTLYIFPHT